MSEMNANVNENVYVDEFSLDALLNPQVSRVAKNLDNLSIVIYGDNGTGKTPVACQFPKPYYLAFGKSGISGLNGVPFKPFYNWADYKKFADTMFDPKNFEMIKSRFNTFIFDETETAFRYCEQYVASIEGVNKIKEANKGYGAWKDWETEWKDEILRILGSGFTIIFIFKQEFPENRVGAYPRGDKRMLPAIIDNCDVVGWMVENGHEGAIHSSLVLKSVEGQGFARTRNQYFEPYIDDVTAEKIIEAYYNAIDAQANAEGVAPVSKEEYNDMFKKKSERNIDEAKAEIDGLIDTMVNLHAKIDPAHGQESAIMAAQEIIWSILGQGKRFSEATQKQIEGVEVIISKLKKYIADFKETNNL